MDMLKSMAAPALLMRCALWLAAVLTARGRLPLPTVNLTIPVNPVREDTVLSIHCKINKLNSGHIVNITRRAKNGTTLELFWGENKNAHPNERIFTAVREFPDKSIVYFVTIIHASRSDQGTYFCSVMSNSIVIAEEAAFVDVEYFPSEDYPLCHTAKHFNYRIIEGTRLSLNCTTQKGHPPVSITWEQVRPGSKDSVRDEDVITEHTGTNDLVTSTLITIPTIEDNASIFVCSIRSAVYDGRVYTCHIGPLNILPKPNLRTSDTTYKTSPNPMTSSNLTTNLYDSGLNNNIKFHTWAIVVAATICIIVLTIGTTFIIVFYGLGYSKRGRVVDNNLHPEYHRGHDVRVEYRRSAEPNIYVAV